MRILKIRSIIGDKDRDKIYRKIRDTFRVEDFDDWFVINDVEFDIIASSNLKKMKILENFLIEIGVLISSQDLNLDDILDKIECSGVESLFKYEKIYLNGFK